MSETLEELKKQLGEAHREVGKLDAVISVFHLIRTKLDTIRTELEYIETLDENDPKTEDIVNYRTNLVESLFEEVSVLYSSVQVIDSELIEDTE